MIFAVLTGRDAVDTAEELDEVGGVMTVAYHQGDVLDRHISCYEQLGSLVQTAAYDVLGDARTKGLAV